MPRDRARPLPSAASAPCSALCTCYRSLLVVRCTMTAPFIYTTQSFYMALQPKYTCTTYTRGFPHLDTFSTKETECFDRCFSQATLPCEKANKQADDSSFSFCRHHRFYEYISACVLLALFPHVLATVISYSDHSQENKAAITAVHDEACLRRIDQDCWK